MKDKTTELEGEKEKLEKQRSHMEKRINQMARNGSELIKGVLLSFNNLKHEHTEMQVQKKQQDKIHEELQCMLQEIQRRTQQLEDMHNEYNREMQTCTRQS